MLSIWGGGGQQTQKIKICIRIAPLYLILTVGQPHQTTFASQNEALSCKTLDTLARAYKCSVRDGVVQTLLYIARQVSFPDPTLNEGKGSGDVGEFSWICTPSRANTNLCK